MNRTILAFESSCDETGVAIYRGDEYGNGEVLANEIFSQIDLHRVYGGVVPELAARDHLKRLPVLLYSALDTANLDLSAIDLIAYTAAPGLPGALLTAASFARTLAYARKIPALPVHHLEGHLLSPLLAADKPDVPFLAMLLSGGHSQILAVEKIGSYRLLGQTLDDAVGEAFDKTAKLLDLPYPGGREIAKLAEEGDVDRYSLPLPMSKKAGLDMSFSGLKTAVRLLIERELTGKNPEDANYRQIRADIAASFQKTVVESLLQKARRAWREFQYRDLVLAGGVAANTLLRQKMTEEAKKLGKRVFFPDLELCGDNALMIAFAASFRASYASCENLAIKTYPRMDLANLPKI
ncbi:MAG: tRNA (adenosine(37)-N6)-threonylcarbamoyltransferase complex transferase subunit TsaD [Cardiobacteriaceae bacterium]|nr:tRNA (adenosine(37)-N6)-threonylcarbamoyltransferase complex transferase subunit TsaD [Cardiobacteriaceae bacterium]